MFETPDSIIIQMELSGVAKEDIGIELNGGSIEINGVKRRREFAGSGSFHRMERPFGFFKRIFDLPAAVDIDAIRARFSDGLLEVVIPKKRRSEVTFCISGIEIAGD